MWLICSQQFFRAAGYGFYGTWFPRFLQETRNVTMLQSGFLTTLPVLAVAVGSAAGGGLVDWIQQRTGNQRLSRQALAIVCLSLCAVCIFLAYFIADATQAVLLITLGSLFSGLGGPAGMTLTVDLSGRHIATSFATMNMAGNFGAAICPVVVARLVDALPRWSITDTTEQWNLVLFFFVAIYVAAAVCWMFLNPNRPIFAKEPIS
jgi:ACS family glucarate transporter-like MFS transporter/ACS family D-galactonate transporter-like MFS transporter